MGGGGSCGCVLNFTGQPLPPCTTLHNSVILSQLRINSHIVLCSVIHTGSNVVLKLGESHKDHKDR